MSEQRIRIIDAFTDRPYAGNAAGVVILDRPAAPAWMQAVAGELNLSETAFAAVASDRDADYELRWFTPLVEVDLCGHATLALGHALQEDGVAGPVHCATRSGVLTVSWSAAGITLDFPRNDVTPAAPPAFLAEALNVVPVWTGWGGTGDLVVQVDSEETVRAIRPDMAALEAIDCRGVIVTAAAAEPGTDHDFVSRFFAPRVGIPEDPVTGSAHTVLGPYWAAELGKEELVGLQLSPRGGTVGVRLAGNRVLLRGHATTVLRGVLHS